MKKIFFIVLLLGLIAVPVLAYFGDVKFGAAPFEASNFGTGIFGQTNNQGASSGDTRVTPSGDRRVPAGTSDVRVIP